LNDDELAARIRSDGIDILVDLSGHTKDNRLLTFARKPAPVQVSWLGYANTTGLRGMDYILADPITLPPEEERFYTEKPWRLPESYICFTPPDDLLEVAPLPAMTNGYLTFGCFNNPAKISDSVIACWSAKLEALPQSAILFKYKSFETEADREAFRKRFSRLGIDPARLSIEGKSPRKEYLESYRHIDCALDPFPFPGLTTTCEALWMGVPTLTMRVARGIYGHNGELLMTSVGLPEWVAESVEEYVEKAVSLTGDLQVLASLRKGLRAALLRSPLCDAERFARHLEAAFRGMLTVSY
jgi:predicted O-linked N-acetylglucosamine transferase (SPINDLY family)